CARGGDHAVRQLPRALPDTLPQRVARGPRHDDPIRRRVSRASGMRRNAIEDRVRSSLLHNRGDIMPNNRAGSRVGRWGATLLVALVLTGTSYQAAAAAAQQTATAGGQQTVTAAAHQRASAAPHPTATAVAGSRQAPPRLTK